MKTLAENILEFKDFTDEKIETTLIKMKAKKEGASVIAKLGLILSQKGEIGKIILQDYNIFTGF